MMRLKDLEMGASRYWRRQGDREKVYMEEMMEEEERRWEEGRGQGLGERRGEEEEG